MSLLLDHGHSEAGHYPIGMLQDEAQLVAERLQSEDAGAAILMQAAMASTQSKKAGPHFVRLIEKLLGH